MKRDLKIMIADDNKNILYMMKELIERNTNLKIYMVVESSKDQIEKMNNEEFDFIITDIRRKGENISGLDIILKAEKEKRKEKFILVTASTKSEILKYSDNKISENIVGYIVKPFNYEALIQMIKRIICEKE